MPPDRCYLCASASLVPYARRMALPHVRCRNCGLIVRHPLPSETGDEGWYQEGYYADRETYPDWEGDPHLAVLLAHRLRRIEVFCSPPGRILDVGCGLGHFLKLARAHGWDAIGTDTSAVAVERARCLARVEVIHGRLDQAKFPSRAFDAVCFWDVLEHLAEPRGALGEAHRLLRPGGLLAVSMPNVRGLRAGIERTRWRYFRPEFGHLMHYGPATLSRLLSDGGFRVTAVDTEGAFNLAALTRAAPRVRQLPAVRRLLSIAQRSLDSLVRALGVGENMAAFAHRVP